jgi:uncharacterized membrane protein YfcA
MPDELWLFPLLFATGLTAGLIDSIAGGGGLITLPVLLAVGLPPKLALGTNKFQSSFGSFTAASYFRRHGVVNLRDAKAGIVATFAGAAAGAWVVQQVDSAWLSSVVPYLLLVVALYSLFTPKLGLTATTPRMSSQMFFVPAGLVLGFYDGFFGPGVGSLWAITIISAIGFDLMKATGYTKVMNFASNIASLLLFLIGGQVWFVGGLMMAGGQIIGSRLGAGLAVKRGARFIRPLYIAVVLATILKLVFG